MYIHKVVTFGLARNMGECQVEEAIHDGFDSESYAIFLVTCTDRVVECVLSL